jgi:protein involved in polysaccharide export with SLBB domain
MSMIKLCRRLGCWRAVGGLLIAGLFLAGCHSPTAKKSSSAAPGSPSGAEINSLEPEVLRAGDSLTINFLDLPTPSQPSIVKIKEDGTITLLWNQTFTAAGKTRGSLEKEIRECYVPRYFKYMTVTITRETQSLFYYLDGEVKAPARQLYVSRITVLKAIASAGGFTDYAKKRRVKLTRLDGRKVTVNCIKALDDASLDLEIYPGDKIYVPRKLF